MRDLPIAFKGPMVSAILGGRKTCTRRLLTKLKRFGKISDFGVSTTSGYDWHFRDSQMRWHDLRNDELLQYLPYRAGDLRWVKENWSTLEDLDHVSPNDLPRSAVTFFEADGSRDAMQMAYGGRSRRGMHMPKSRSRITLRVAEVSIEPLRSISNTDAKAEGIAVFQVPGSAPIYSGVAWPETAGPGELDLGGPAWHREPVPAFRDLWDSINSDAQFRFNSNPWVIVVRFVAINSNVFRVLGSAA